ncbi:hypothetical protein IDH44_07825 [Paenibacillus sp. IB182496]|uniref:Uncharacterized protein n=1 Tax=Paenibacillus sabuli TaxID=2772509 RepID=A0A927BQX1_9BACL|nr:hypothetical protein [Paenibacillus sabuli]MBD2845096.1 hypothetical protein [Paenibacillus sabuli]
MRTINRAALLALATALALMALLPHLASAAAEATPLRPVQVFDVKAGKVVKTLDNDKQYQDIAAAWLKSAGGPAPQLGPDDKCGFVYRIPLEGAMMVKVRDEQVPVQDVFLFHCEGKQPVLLVFDAKHRPFLLEFNGDLKPFLSKIGERSGK